MKFIIYLNVKFSIKLHRTLLRHELDLLKENISNRLERGRRRIKSRLEGKRHPSVVFKYSLKETPAGPRVD